MTLFPSDVTSLHPWQSFPFAMAVFPSMIDESNVWVPAPRKTPPPSIAEELPVTVAFVNTTNR